MLPAIASAIRNWDNSFRLIQCDNYSSHVTIYFYSHDRAIKREASQVSFDAKRHRVAPVKYGNNCKKTEFDNQRAAANETAHFE